MTRVALIGHSKPKTPRAKARISKTLSDHAVANSWWSPSRLPTWLDKEFYVQNIQPQLRTVKVREIAQAMQVSQPYAAFIRSGRRSPHPRHWQALARLAGVGQTPKNEPKTSDSVKELMAMVTGTASDQTPPNPVARIVRRHYQISFNPN
jgi:hypothetical protein